MEQLLVTLVLGIPNFGVACFSLYCLSRIIIQLMHHEEAMGALLVKLVDQEKSGDNLQNL